MKSPGQIIIIIIAALALLAGGFIAGGAYASRRAAYSANSGSLVYLTAIHHCLAVDKPDNARKVTATAIDNHVGVLRNLRTWPSLGLAYAIPWDRQHEQLSEFILSQTRVYASKYPDEMRPETRTFLSSTTEQ